jgi:hypothetical protein
MMIVTVSSGVVHAADIHDYITLGQLWLVACSA